MPMEARSTMLSWSILALMGALGCHPTNTLADDTREIAEANLEATIRGALSFYNAHSDDDLFPMSNVQCKQLRKGEVVRIQRKVPITDVSDKSDPFHERLTAYILVPQPMEQLWLASMSPEFNSTDRLTKHCIALDESGNSCWYQHLALPWPISDRHWVIDLKLNTQLCESAQGGIWERSWQLTDNGRSMAEAAVESGDVEGLTPEDIADDIYIPMNRGAWIMFRIEENWTLIAYRVTTSFGGSIPDALVNSLGASLVTGLLNGVEEFAPGMKERYTAGHPVEFSGAGFAIPYYETPDQ